MCSLAYSHPMFLTHAGEDVHRFAPTGMLYSAVEMQATIS